MRRIQIIPKNLDQLNEICQTHSVNLEVNAHQIILNGKLGVPGCWLEESKHGLRLVPVTEMASETARGEWEQNDDGSGFWMPVHTGGTGNVPFQYLRVTNEQEVRAFVGDNPDVHFSDNAQKYPFRLRKMQVSVGDWLRKAPDGMLTAHTAEAVQKLVLTKQLHKVPGTENLYTNEPMLNAAISKEQALEDLESALGGSKADRLMRMFIKAHDTFVDKNGDYGDAFAYTLRKHGDKAPLIRITDKFLRIETLLTGREAAVKDETVMDTILDLGCYCFMWLMEKEVLRDEHV